MQLISGLNNSVPIIAVYNKNKTLSVLEIVPPQGTNLQSKKHKYLVSVYQHSLWSTVMHKNQNFHLVLATNIPNSEANVLVFYSLNIEPWNKKPSTHIYNIIITF